MQKPSCGRRLGRDPRGATPYLHPCDALSPIRPSRISFPDPPLRIEGRRCHHPYFMATCGEPFAHLAVRLPRTNDLRGIIVALKENAQSAAHPCLGKPFWRRSQSTVAITPCFAEYGNGPTMLSNSPVSYTISVIILLRRNLVSGGSRHPTILAALPIIAATSNSDSGIVLMGLAPRVSWI